ncbi:hypothetical protein [Bradyrhizobium ottawaense]|uniref:hypothetical protein n=1 Tax=Bradyrhizobium ottawaense TaxID=931866 RepID=UPI0004071ABA|nr:hypothetical protein [Bradyrhizobium ottawaense]
MVLPVVPMRPQLRISDISPNRVGFVDSIDAAMLNRKISDPQRYSARIGKFSGALAE